MTKKKLIMFQQNFSCIDKIKIWYNFNNRTVDQSYELFTNSIFFLPGQKFYDLDLEYSKTDLDTHNMGSFMFPKVDGTANKEKYGDTFKQVLSVYISEKAKIDPDKIKYIIVSCCRNIDYNIQKNKNNSNATLDFYNDAFIYENALHYYNIIMLGNFTNIGSAIRQKTASYVGLKRGTITTTQLVDEHMKELIDLFKENFVKCSKIFNPGKSGGIFDSDLEPNFLDKYISGLFDDNHIKITYNKYGKNDENDGKANLIIDSNIKDYIRIYLYKILDETISELTKRLEKVSPEIQSFKNTKRSYRLGHVGRRFLETKLRSISDGSYKASPKISPIVDKLLVDIGEFIH